MYSPFLLSKSRISFINFFDMLFSFFSGNGLAFFAADGAFYFCPAERGRFDAEPVLSLTGYIGRRCDFIYDVFKQHSINFAADYFL